MFHSWPLTHCRQPTGGWAIQKKTIQRRPIVIATLFCSRGDVPQSFHVIAQPTIVTSFIYFRPFVSGRPFLSCRLRYFQIFIHLTRSTCLLDIGRLRSIIRFATRNLNKIFRPYSAAKSALLTACALASSAVAFRNF